MKSHKWQIKFGLALIFASVLLYTSHYFIFKDPHHLFIFMLGELAFLPLEVLLVGLVLDKFIEKREKESMLEKLNMIIGVFFNEVGTEVLHKCAEADPNIKHIKNNMLINDKWSDKDFKDALRAVSNYEYEIDMSKVDLNETKNYLYRKREFLLKLLENPNILEHDTFTHLLTSVFHLEEELATRDLSSLDEEEIEHLKGDVIRVYSAIISQWILYMKHLKNNFPFLFNSAVKINPFI